MTLLKGMIMNTKIQNHKLSCSLIFALGLFVCTTSNAWYGGGGYYHGGGGYYHRGYYGGNYYHGGYYGRGWGGGAVVVGVPLGGYYYGSRCSIVQRCYQNGRCVQQRICN